MARQMKLFVCLLAVICVYFVQVLTAKVVLIDLFMMKSLIVFHLLKQKQKQVETEFKQQKVIIKFSLFSGKKTTIMAAQPPAIRGTASRTQTFIYVKNKSFFPTKMTSSLRTNEQDFSLCIQLHLCSIGPLF